MKCIICKNEFSNKQALSKHVHSKHKLTNKNYYDTYFKKDNEGICTTCGKPTPFKSLLEGYQVHCCAKCAQNDPNVNNSFRNNNPQRNPIIKEKTKQTCIIKYGGPSLANKQVREKAKQTLLAKYGVENIYQLKSVQQKARENSHSKQANDKRHQVILDKIRTYAKEINATFVQDMFNMTKSSGWYQSGIFKSIKYKGYLFIKNEDIPKILEYDNNSYKVYSIAEKSIVQAIKSIYNGTIIENSKKIIPHKELDIYLPDLNLAIEYNGCYFHSSTIFITKDYHLQKSLLCRERNIRLIHIYEFEDLNKQIELLKDLILGTDNYPKNDFNKNNLIKKIPKPELIYDDGRLQIYGAGLLK